MNLREKILLRTKVMPSGCWEWQGCVTPGPSGGYGQIRYGGRILRVHRAMLGEPSGMVCHHCDNPPCVNPDHLYVGDAKTNAEDRDLRGRRTAPKGAENGRAKLTGAQVALIRRSPETNVALAQRFGVSDVAVSYARRGKTW
jgi:hypothetical protein